ncbi:NAD(P)-dependent oxidoreductase [Mangrovibacterium sp.]|uniref:NAD(P)-dependent oxidoreductase n=1 Tax=Mangrovibacterium sp. TaxID=1961364 RepID=UPI0035615A84
MKRVLIATEKPFAPVALEKITDVINRAGYKLDLLEKYKTKAELLAAVSTANALIVRSDLIDRDVLDAGKNLEIVVRAGAGYDNVDTSYAKERSVVVMNTPGQNSNAVAELAIGLAIYGIRGFFGGNSGGELRGRTLGLHGYGYVARNVHRIARAFGMNVKVYTRYSKAQASSEGLEVTASLEELYASSDVVSIHVPARGEHLKSVSMAVLKHLKEGAIIVNTARKEVINEDDLCRFMEDRIDVKYLSDIAPDCAAKMISDFEERCYFTPKKIGAQTEEANTNAGVAAAEQIVGFFANGDQTFRVNK